MISISSMFRDPVLRDAFQRAERDDGCAYAVPAPVDPVLNGGSSVQVDNMPPAFAGRQYA